MSLLYVSFICLFYMSLFIRLFHTSLLYVSFICLFYMSLLYVSFISLFEEYDLCISVIESCRSDMDESCYTYRRSAHGRS